MVRLSGTKILHNQFQSIILCSAEESSVNGDIVYVLYDGFIMILSGI